MPPDWPVYLYATVVAAALLTITGAGAWAHGYKQGRADGYQAGKTDARYAARHQQLDAQRAARARR